MMPYDAHETLEKFRSQIFVEVMDKLQQNLGETVTTMLITSVGRVILDAEVIIPPDDSGIYEEGSELVGSTEAANLLGVSRQRVSQLEAAGKLPPPVAHLTASRIWKKTDIEQVAAERQALRNQMNQPKVRRTKYEL